MRIKYELPCIFASIVLMLGAAVKQTPKSIQQSKLSEIIAKHMSRNNPQVTKATKTDTGLCYIMENGAKIERRGGSIAWRNNNPGCIRYSGKAVKMGAVGTANGFAIFPNEETGMRAIKTLLLSDAYRNLTIAKAIHKYAPPHENNTANYINSLCGLVGVSRYAKIYELNDEQLNCVVTTIRRLEGWIIGTELHTSAPKKINELPDLFAAADKTRRTRMLKHIERTL